MSVDPQYIKMINFKKNGLLFYLILCLLIADDTYAVVAGTAMRDCKTSISLSGIFYNERSGAAYCASIKLIYLFPKVDPSLINSINNSSNSAIRRYIAYLRSYANAHAWILNPKQWCQEAEKRCMEPLRLLRFESDIYPSPQIRLRSESDYETYKKMNSVVVDEETFLKRLIRLDNIDAAKDAKIEELESDVRENIKDYITHAKSINIKDVDNLKSIDSYCITKCVEQLNAVDYSNISLINGNKNKIINDGSCARVFADAKKKKGGCSVCHTFRELGDYKLRGCNDWNNTICLKNLEFKEKKLEEWCINKCI